MPPASNYDTGQNRFCAPLPALILYGYRDWFLSHELSQKWLVGLQLFRIIGGVFLIEMTRGHIPGIFAYPAGIGDIVVGVAAFIVLLAYLKFQRRDRKEDV